ncbi:MAG TPA: outer membrane beta-barrel protein [Reyranella sp.]|nr:outer membrane beta-barrel protein [Reyranella sp.]
MTVRKSIGLALAAGAALLAAPLAASAQQMNSSWEGFYAGLNAGGEWGQTSAALGYSASGGGGLFGTGSGFLGGAQVGYNWLIGPVVLGPEVDFQGSTMTSNINGGVGNSTINATSSMPWFSTFRVRAGYPVGSVMPYVTGGAVWGHQRLQGMDTPNGYFDVSNNFWTYTFGGGIEGKLNDKWSAKLEYLWLGTPDTPLSSPATTSISERSIGNVVRVGVNYRFN